MSAQRYPGGAVDRDISSLPPAISLNHAPLNEATDLNSFDDMARWLGLRHYMATKKIVDDNQDSIADIEATSSIIASAGKHLSRQDPIPLKQEDKSRDGKCVTWADDFVIPSTVLNGAVNHNRTFPIKPILRSRPKTTVHHTLPLERRLTVTDDTLRLGTPPSSLGTSNLDDDTPRESITKLSKRKLLTTKMKELMKTLW